MADFIVATASTADLPREFLEEHDVPFISYTYIMNEELYEDACREETKNEVYKKMRSGVGLTTSMINTYSYIEFFEKLMDTGKDVIFLDMSQKLSTSYISAAEATEHIHQKYPNQRFYNVDTRCVSGGLGLLVFLGIEEGDSRTDADYICSKTIGLRVFDDAEGVPNLSVEEIGGSVLIVSQFTLCADA